MNQIVRLFWILPITAILVCCSQKGQSSFPGELFKSSDGKEFVKLLDARRAEVLLPGEKQSLVGSYRIEQDDARVVVTLPGTSAKTYGLRDKDLVNMETGALLQRIPF